MITRWPRTLQFKCALSGVWRENIRPGRESSIQDLSTKLKFCFGWQQLRRNDFCVYVTSNILVKGFAITLALGLITSVFTVLWYILAFGRTVHQCGQGRFLVWFMLCICSMSSLRREILVPFEVGKYATACWGQVSYLAHVVYLACVRHGLVVWVQIVPNNRMVLFGTLFG